MKGQARIPGKNELPPLSKQMARQHALAIWTNFLSKESEKADRMLELLQKALDQNRKPHSRILTTYPLPGELDCLAVVLQQACAVYLPRTNGPGLMDFRLYKLPEEKLPQEKAHGIEKGYGGIPGGSSSHPVLDLPLRSDDIVIIPCLAINPGGYRLGRGGGFYDRLKRQLEPGLLLGLLPSSLINFRFQEKAHDIRLDLLITDAGERKYN